MLVCERTPRSRLAQPATKGLVSGAPARFSALQVLHDPGYGLDPMTRGAMGARFGHDFSQVRIHHGEQAGQAAAAVRAQAFTVGTHIVFGRGRYAPHHPSGQYLLAHELAHTIQQEGATPLADLAIAPHDTVGETEARRGSGRALLGTDRPRLTGLPSWRIQRVGIWEAIARLLGYGSYSDDELADYLRTLRERGRLEGNSDSDDKARATTQRWINGNSPFVLTPALIALMILEMQSGFTGDDDERAILELLERSPGHALAAVFQSVSPRELNSDFHGDEWDRLQDFYRRRFQGGMAAVLAGQIRPLGDAVPLGTPLSERRVARAQDPNPGDRIIAPPRTIREPENCHSYEDWLRQFRDLPTFVDPGGHRVIGPREGPAPEATATDPNADPSVRRPPLAHGREAYLPTDRHIAGPPEAWLNANLPPHLVRVAYQLPSDCADIGVILRHVWLVAHRRSEVYGRWLIGSQLDDPRSEEIQSLIRGPVYSGNVQRIVRPYSGPGGSPIRSFAGLENLLHPGDVLVWEHQDWRGNRSGGHTQTITGINRTGDEITRIEVVQGNQPINREEAEAIRARDRSAPSVSELRAAPGRRIEASSLSGRESLRGHRLGDLGGVWGWLDDPANPRSKRDVLIAAGPPATRHEPAGRGGRRGSDVVRGLEDWTAEMAGTSSLNELLSFYEASLLEARSLIEGGHGDSLSETEARAFGRAAGEALWRLASQSARQRSEIVAASGSNPRRILDTHLLAEDLGAEAHYRPLQHMLGMLDAMARLARSGLVRERFGLIRQELEPAARGMTSITLERPNAPRGLRTANVLVTGFDPFRFDAAGRQVEPEAGDWNPSGAAVLQLDGEVLPVAGNLQAAVEGVIFPVRYDQFRAGLVESVVRPLLPRVDGVVTVSMDPNIAPAGAPRMERYAVGIHRLNNGEVESIPPVTVEGQPSSSEPGRAILESQGDIPDIARESGLPPAGLGTRVTLEFGITRAGRDSASAVEEANRFRRALGLPTNDQTSEVQLDFLANAGRIRGIERGVQGTGITMQIGDESFQAAIMRGPGGSFLSNEVSYRVLRAIQESPRRGRVTSFHVHTPRGGEGSLGRIPEEAETAEQRSTRFRALQTARGVLTRLTATLRRMIGAIARRAFPQGQAAP